MKRGKSPGPDKIPNEMFIEADQQARKEITNILNNISTTYNIPQTWQHSEVIRLYKGKGKKGKCSNERGITLASNFGKLYERIINNRVLEQVNISKAQAGGKKGIATVDHTMVVKDLIQEAKTKKNPVYIVFLDVTKAYDKAWLDAIMFVLHKEGVRDNTWTLTKKLCENLTAQIHTKHGLTRNIRIKDSIRQGGVLSVVQYATLMDEINKEILKRNLGMTLPSNQKIGCLLWMDDVALVSTDPKELEAMLDITYDVASKYHIEFGKEKSKVMKIGKKGPEQIFKLGDMTLEYTENYKYLGEILNKQNNMKDHITNIKGKTEAAYQTIMTITADSRFRDIEMETIWKLIETCIQPTITHGCETWKLTKTETNEINKIQENIIRRILMVPQGTPKETLYIESGLLDIDTIRQKARMMMENRLMRQPNNLAVNIKEEDIKHSWKDQNTVIKQKYNINDTDLSGTKQMANKNITPKIINKFKEETNDKTKDKSKAQYLLEGIQHEWTPNKRPTYMTELTRIQASTIFKARTRMLDVKNNFRGKYNTIQCRLCKANTETQEHILEECPIIHKNNELPIIRKSDFFSTTDTDTLKQTANTIQKIMKILITPQ